MYKYSIEYIYVISAMKPQSPCEPTPCGPNSVCQQINMQAVCSCLPNYVGLPPSCRPECVVNSECDTSKACINQRCDDPCPNTCGLKAHCLVRNHNPICTCPADMTGDPFTQCYRKYLVTFVCSYVMFKFTLWLF